MTALPKKRISSRRQGKRRAQQQHDFKLPNLGTCRYCRQPKLPHTLCPNCKKY